MEEKNIKARFETFCDGVFAIALTLLIIDIRIPSGIEINSTAALWMVLWQLTPSMLAFLLSFIVIFISWVNHHEALKLVHKISPHFIYANGLLLLAVVVTPFPTSLLGEYILTDHAAPAVVLYCAVFGLQAIAWVFMTSIALSKRNPLLGNEKAKTTARSNLKKGHYAMVLYTLCMIAAFWFPLTIAIFVGFTWILWLVVGVNLKEK